MVNHDLHQDIILRKLDTKRINTSSNTDLALWRKQVNKELNAIEDLSFYRRPSFLQFSPDDSAECTWLNYNSPHYGGRRYQLDRSTRYALLWAIDAELETRGIFPY